jgi:hypothetical protein
MVLDIHPWTLWFCHYSQLDHALKSISQTVKLQSSPYSDIYSLVSRSIASMATAIPSSGNLPFFAHSASDNVFKLLRRKKYLCIDHTEAKPKTNPM